jgi:hypothetical protein
MKPEEVSNQRPEFAEFEPGRFFDNLQALRKQIVEKNDHTASYSSAHARRIHPKSMHNNKGELRWEGSERNGFMIEYKHKSMKPKELYHSRKEYYVRTS